MTEIIVYRNPMEKMMWDFWLSPGWYGLPWFDDTHTCIRPFQEFDLLTEL